MLPTSAQIRAGLRRTLSIAVLIARPVGRAFAIRTTHAGALVASLGIILSATVTPTVVALREIAARSQQRFDESRCIQLSEMFDRIFALMTRRAMGTMPIALTVFVLLVGPVIVTLTETDVAPAGIPH